MRKPILKFLGATLAAMLLAATVFDVNLVWFRPFSLNLFYEKTFVKFVLQDPELLTSLGIAAHPWTTGSQETTRGKGPLPRDRKTPCWSRDLS